MFDDIQVFGKAHCEEAERGLVRLKDYLNLGAVGIKAHRRRVVIVVMVVGALMSVLIAGCLIIQGVEDRALEEMARVTRREYAEEAEGVPVVLPSIYTAAQWLGIGMHAPGMNTESQVKIAKRIRDEAVGKVVETKEGARYYVADLLPGGGFRGTLTISKNSEYNPLDLVLRQVDTSMVPGMVVGKEAKGATDLAIATIGENFRGVWRAYGIVSAILLVVAVVIELSTYIRLIGQDTKTIALYYAMGATHGQIRRIYVIYLLTLSLLAVMMAVGVGMILAVVVSLVNAEGLAQAFMLEFGVEVERVWLVGWNVRIWKMAVVVLLVAPVAVLVSWRQFGGKKLAQKIK